jgi:aspartate dehydrogenase
MSSASPPTFRVCVLGFGEIGHFLCHVLLAAALPNEPAEPGADSPRASFIRSSSVLSSLPSAAAAVASAAGCQLVGVWNRTAARIEEDPLVPRSLIMRDPRDLPSPPPDLVVEVAHPAVVRDHLPALLSHCNVLLGSPTSLADPAVHASIMHAATPSAVGPSAHALFVASGAFWGATDIMKMADRGTLRGLRVTMKKHPSSFKVEGDVRSRLDAAVAADADGEVILYDGPVRQLCPQAPNNVNTMAAAALAGHSLGFDGVHATLISDKSLTSAHIVEVEVFGPPQADGSPPFSVVTRRYNPAKVGAVTGSATFISFLSSVVLARGKSSGLHFC